MKTSIKKIICFIAVTSLMACGGGGNESSTPQAITTPAATVMAEKMQTLVTPYYPQNSLQYEVITALNQYRKDLKVGGLNPNKFIDIAASNHQNYLNLNTINEENFHTEVQGRPGFTGTSPQTRMLATGYSSNNPGAEVATAGYGTRAIDIFLDTVYHRQGLSHEDLADVGISSSNEFGTIIDLNSNGNSVQNNAGDFASHYPFDGQNNIPLTHYAEAPWPFPELPPNTLDSLCNHTSYPIHFQVQKLAKLDVTSFTLQESLSGLNIPVRLLTSQTDSKIFPNFAFIVGNVPLKKVTKYTVRFVGSSTGQFTGAPKGILTIDKTWTFTTGDTNLVSCGSL